MYLITIKCPHCGDEYMTVVIGDGKQYTGGEK
jgi:hypothetical protein